MRKFATLLAAMLVAVSAMAIPAHRGSSTVAQPDGSKLTINLIGDEFYHFNTTLDGYTVVKNAAGVYEYAMRSDQSLVASGVKAHDEASRTAAEKAFLAQTSKYLTDREAHAQGEAQRVKRDARAKAPGTQALDYKKFRGLIILINLTDVKFSMQGSKAFYNNMVNTKGFTGYTDDSGKWVSCTGSMRDYYSENSNGNFDPEFDIIGPVTVSYSSTSFNGTSNASAIFRAALTAANTAGCDFTRYDADNDGYIDMVFFQVAGMSSSFAGNDSRLLWPHKSSLYSSTTYDGKRVGIYACSTELYGWSSEPSTIAIEGIGTMCHEFTHVMGFPDLYDTNYETGGESHHPGEWDIMAGGGSFNCGRTPVGYTIFERYALGFAHPTVITAPGHYTLRSVANNEGYILRSPFKNEYFIIDNRQKTRWDSYLPGHGMVVCRVDSSSTTVWTGNTVNCNPSHNYYEMVRAGNSKSGAAASDPFPGSTGKTQFHAMTTPALKTWNGTTLPLGFYNIAEKSGVIEFDIMNASDITKLVEDFENMPATTNKSAQGVQGTFAKWDFSSCYVEAPTAADVCNGKQAARMVRPGTLTMATPLYYNMSEVSFDAVNTSNSAAKLTFSYSTDMGKTWTALKNTAGTTPVTVAANSKSTCTYPVEFKNTEAVLYRIYMGSGSTSVPLYVDDLTIVYSGEPGKPYAAGDVNGDGTVDINDANALLDVMLGAVQPSVYEGRADVNGDGVVDVQDSNAIIDIILRA